MHFKLGGRIPLVSAFVTGCLAFNLTGCGMLGTASPPSGSGANVKGATGCLDNSKDLVNRYVKGEMSQTEWNSSFDCINQSLEFFTNYVRGSEVGGYSQTDMFNLVSQFLITSKTNPIQPELLTAAFNLKSALFGGNDQAFTQDEIATLKTTLTKLSNITGGLIPYLQIRQSANPSYDQLLDMVAAFKTAGDQLADVVNTLPVGMMSDQAMISLINQLTVTLNINLIDNIGNDVFLTKWLLFNTRRDAIEASDWSQLFRTSLGVAGVALAFKTAVGDNPEHPLADRLQNDYRFREFLWSLANQVKPYLEQMLAAHGGVAPFPIFDHIIDALPADFLGSMPKDTFKQSLRPMFRKLLGSTTKEGLDQGILDTLFNLGGTVVADLGLLDRFYEATSIDLESVPPLVFAQKLEQFQASLTVQADKDRFETIAKKLLTYQPEFHKTTLADGDHHTVWFSPNTGYSHFQNFLVLGIDNVARMVQSSYGTVPDAFAPNDFVNFFTDFTPILFAMDVVDPTVPNFGPNRIRDMDLFTPIGNGDNLGQIEELVSYAMTIISAGDLTNRMKTVLYANCTPVGTDIMGWNEVPADCFRDQFENHLDDWIADFPRLKNYWAHRTDTEKAQAMKWLEHGSRRDGYNNEPFGKFDINAMATILHYTEGMFDRFDFDRDEALSTAEVNSAYPVFKGIIQRTAAAKGTNLSGDYLLKGVFSYIVKYRSMPATNLTDIKSDAKLAGWLLTYWLPTTKYNTDRLGIFNIVCQLAGPANPNLTQPNNIVCQ